MKRDCNSKKQKVKSQSRKKPWGSWGIWGINNVYLINFSLLSIYNIELKKKSCIIIMYKILEYIIICMCLLVEYIMWYFEGVVTVGEVVRGFGNTRTI
jgi:hypothetical protein